ncbi:FAD-dependent oxidoreductase [Thermodesulfobacteriota bacterium]
MEHQDTYQIDKQAPKILVIGGGVGGIRCALDIAESGKNVVLIDKSCSIGGLMSKLDRTFPTNNCDLCTVSPHLSESGRELHIDILTMTQVVGVCGEVGNFTVTLEIAPRYIDLAKCTACGDCLKKFPDCVRFSPGLDPRAPTCMRYPQATPSAFSIDMDKCKNRDELVAVCKAGAILPDDTARTVEMPISAIILACGAELFDYKILDNYGNGSFPNVVSGLEYERIMSASGPTGGTLIRPSDGKQPRRIAWVQCVGSRDINKSDMPYCSSVCCMYALKEAMVTKERFYDEIETVIFYMDMRTYGKDYERYLQKARDEYDVKLIRCRPHTIERDEGTENLSIHYITNENPKLQTQEFDMVILSTGFRIAKDLVELADTLGVQANDYGYIQTDTFNPVATSKPGIYVCGLLEGPKDIPDTMVQASAAACQAGLYLDKSNEMGNGREEFPPERDVAGEDIKIGVFVCDCGFNIGGVIDVEEVVDYAGGLPHVTVSKMIGHGCSRESLAQIERTIQEEMLNRIVIGGCSPRTHETKFQDTLRKAGLNKYLVEMANIRDQDTWVHLDQPEYATQKAKDLIRMAASSVGFAHPLIEHELPMNKDVLVVGGGVTGMNTALCVADHGLRVYLVEIEDTLGGNAMNIKKTIDGADVQAYMDSLVDRTMNHKNIQVMTRSIIVDHSGMPGMFATGIEMAPSMQYRRINHGVTILTTGALPHRPKEYLLDEHDAVVTQLEIDALLEEHPDEIEKLETVIMIQCVGSRVPENPNCSRVCCQTAIKNALRIAKINPQARILILYRDIRTYGFYEDYYREARERGVIFAHYSPEEKPVVKPSGDRVEIVYYDEILGRKASVSADKLVLSTGMIADDEATEDLATIFHLPRTDDGYFLEDHVKLRPLDLSIPGFFVAGTAHAPKTIDECIGQAQAAVGRALTLLAKDTINLGAAVARVDAKKCAACLACVRACPFGVPFINADGYSEIDPSKCHGCGVCAAECPAKAIQLMRFEDDQILANVYGLLEGLN